MAFEWANDDTRTFMERGYLQNGETVEQRCRDIADYAEELLGPEFEGYADKLYDYLGRGWFSLASPVWSNFGANGLPISCNNSYIPDSIAGMMTKMGEVGMMSKHGAGTSGFFGDIRPRGTPIATGGTADGPIHFMNLFETNIDVISQGAVRRGNFAAYLPVEHPDIREFLDCREEGSSIQKLSLGVTVTDDWLSDMEAGDPEKREIWARILRKRFETGFPYIIFHDTVNREKADVYHDRGMEIRGSNLCTEIFQPSDELYSFVCCLASMNLLHYDDWKDTDAVRVLTYLLDAVMTEYILKTEGEPHMEAAHAYARDFRAIGIGTLGLHSKLMKDRLPWGSLAAIQLDRQMHKTISDQSWEASQDLAYQLGEPLALIGYGRRHATLMAIAPTTSSSFILGQVSSGIEPIHSNYHTKNLAKGKFTWRNPALAELLEEYDANDETTWRFILQNDGSIQNLTAIDEADREVFKTFAEISPMDIIRHAAARQPVIDQGQSLNLMIHPKTPLRDVNQLMLEAWKSGIKSLYYQKGTNLAQALVRDILSCSACEA